MRRVIPEKETPPGKFRTAFGDHWVISDWILDTIVARQNFTRNAPPMIRGSLIMPVRLLKSIALIARNWLVILRANALTSYRGVE